MKISVREAAMQLEERGLLKRARHDHSERIIEHVGNLLGQPLPADLISFYREGITELGDFYAQTPSWNDYVGWRSADSLVTKLMHADAVPLFDDGCGSLYGLDLTSGANTPAVYFFDHEDRTDTPSYAAGSSLGVFMLLLADKDQAYDEHWPARWELKIDPDIDKCPRAPAIWAAD